MIGRRAQNTQHVIVHTMLCYVVSPRSTQAEAKTYRKMGVCWLLAYTKGDLDHLLTNSWLSSSRRLWRYMIGVVMSCGDAEIRSYFLKKLSNCLIFWGLWAGFQH